MPDAFFAYPSNPPTIGDCVESAAGKVNRLGRLNIDTWPEVDNWGYPISDELLQRIAAADYLIADITRLNFNVTFEIGYAIGCQKRVLPVVNRGLVTDEDKFKEVGVLDTIGHEFYQNSDELAGLFDRPLETKPIPVVYPRDTSAPVYILSTPAYTDAMGHILGRVKKSRLRYRSFPSSEEARLPFTTAIREVAQSIAVIVPLASAEEKNAVIHNVRAAFVAGLAIGLGRRCLILHPQDGHAPLDVRDETKKFRQLTDIDEHIIDLAFFVHEQKGAKPRVSIEGENPLSKLAIGDPVAENEFETLDKYYMRTSEFDRARRGELDVISGRKGTGKTALFSQLRNEIRRNRINVVSDLKPEGYQLIKLKEVIFKYLGEGSREHLITAFWEYLLYMEIAYKLLEKDKEIYTKNPDIFGLYRDLQEVYEVDVNLAVQGDFSERLNNLANALVNRISPMLAGQTQFVLDRDQVNQILRAQHLRELKEKIMGLIPLKQVR